jgi:hypothetical protein
MKNLLVYFIIVIKSLFLVNCTNQPHIKEGVIYPDLISPIYYLDTFQITYPRVAIVDSLPYIFSLEKTLPFANKEDFINQKGVIRFLTRELHFIRTIAYVGIYKHQNWEKTFQDLVTQNEFYFDELFIPDDSLNSIPVYRFAFEPQSFLLTLIAPIDSAITAPGHEDSILEVFYSKDYYPAIIPLYNKQDLKQINKLYYRLLHGYDMD